MKLVPTLLRKTAIVAAAAIVILSASLVLAQDAHKSFDLLKGMEGNWSGKASRAIRLR